MADLSAVLRKTIDGLPNATPQLRAKVYEKARAAIERQIAGASPALADDVVEARRSALADAIDRTEDHYLEQDLADATSDFDVELQTAQVPGPAPAPAQSPRVEPPVARAAAPASLPHVDEGPPATLPGAQKPTWPKASSTSGDGVAGAKDDLRRDPAAPSDRMAPPVAPGGAGPQRSSDRSLPPFVKDQSTAKAKPGAAPDDKRAEPQTKGLFPFPANAETEPSSGLDTASIPAADLAGPRYSNGRRQGKPARNRAPLVAGLLVLLLGGGGALAYVYQDDLVALVGGTSNATTTAAATPPAAPVNPSEGERAAGSEVAALPPGVEAPATTPPEAATAPAAATPSAANGTAKRRYTQRLLPDGTEVDPGPGAANANAFDEGTNIAAASPDAPATLTPPTAAAPSAAPPEVPPTETATPPAETATQLPATPPTPTTETAALQPDTVAGVPAVAQKLVFYEERTETEQGTQRGGNVVWSVVNEAPAEGQPPEPAIRAVADIPEENLRMTMTIRRNADVTLPASHVIELMFDVPPAFTGGQIANVQRLALKPTEEARGEPLIGVAGKISDGFFIIALNNLAQATQSNLDLMGKEQWIDIPLAYATGRRALISIEKGIPGDRVFKEAMDAWAAKT